MSPASYQTAPPRVAALSIASDSQNGEVKLGVEAALVGGELVPGDIEIADGVVRRVGLGSAAAHGIAVPGFVDLQVNGFAGVDFLDTDSTGFERAGRALAETGVTSFLPTLITAPEDRLAAALESIPARCPGAKIIGAHLEGPFVSADRLGVHPADARRDPDPGTLERLLASQRVRLVTLAPELAGAHDLIRALLDQCIPVSLGHSDATANEANAAFDLGVRTVTHVFNAMRPFHHREPGIVGAALARGDVVVQAIFDGVHLAPETEAFVWRAARHRLALVTDHAAIPGGRMDDGTLAGSTTTMIEAVRRLHDLGASLEEAVQAASRTPASVLGDSTAGRLAVGLPADVVVLREDLGIERVLVGGRDAVD
jgi:N-acetylglucosamine-6-phosphate deacetylase